jgi:protein-tyrosine phosphatase
LGQVAAATGGIVRLYSGCDFHLSYDNIEDALKNPRKYTINRNRYLLVEFSDLLIFPTTNVILARLQDAGMTPIITHPERNRLLRKRLDEMAEWCGNGALIQVTGGSLLGHFGNSAFEFCRTLLDRQLVHFIASDGHNADHRPPTMDAAYAWLVQNYSETLAKTLCIANPRAVLTGERVDPAPAAPARKPRKWFQVWR